MGKHDVGPIGHDHGAPQWPCPNCGRPEGPVLGVCGCEHERPLLAPLPADSPWWAKVLHWLGVRAVGQR